MLHAGGAEGRVERGHLVGRDALVRPAEQSQHRRGERIHEVERRRGVVAPRPGERAVQADDASEVEAERCGQERHPPTHAEAQREHGLWLLVVGAGIAAHGRDGRLDVGGDPAPGRLRHVRRVVEVGAASFGARGPAEPIDGDRVRAPLREPQRELLVVGMEPAHIGQDHDRGASRRGRAGAEGREPVPVARRELREGAVDRAARDRGDGWPAVVVEAHVERPPEGCAEVRPNPATIEWRAMPNPLVVQKFGGSSVAGADRIKRVARRIARERAAGHDLVVVVSAMGDTTDELLGLAAGITDEPDPRELDVLLATGEHQSATLVSMALHAIGISAISLSGPQAGITTDGTYGRARIAGIEPRRVRAELEGGKVVIVAGFQGQSATSAIDQEITTLGRGGSDTTAVALAAALQADRCQIFTDVRGIFTADPRLVPMARQLPIVGYEEMLELAHQGAQVMQVRAVELGWVNDVVIEVLSSFEDAPGTLIKEDPLVEQRNKVRGLAHDRNVAKVTVVAVPDRPGIARAIFDPLAAAGVNIDLIVQNVGHGGETDLSFTVPQVELGKAKKTLDPVVRELGARELTTDASVAKVSIVGAGLHNAPGYAARMFGTLADAGVNIEMISTSEVRITCMIAEDELETALRALHEAFELERPEPIEVAAAG